MTQLFPLHVSINWHHKGIICHQYVPKCFVRFPDFKILSKLHVGCLVYYVLRSKIWPHLFHNVTHERTDARFRALNHSLKCMSRASSMWVDISNLISSFMLRLDLLAILFFISERDVSGIPPFAETPVSIVPCVSSRPWEYQNPLHHLRRHWETAPMCVLHQACLVSPLHAR